MYLAWASVLRCWVVLVSVFAPYVFLLGRILLHLAGCLADSLGNLNSRSGCAAIGLVLVIFRECM